MNRLLSSASAWCLWLAAAAVPAATVYLPGTASPPLPSREFRGVWVATVNNIDWPSKPGLPVPEQKAELLALLDHAQQLRLNAVVFQVRPACDALYASRLEPWSEYLTGEMGRAPKPFYDPLELIVREAHLRGLELHAWFNPFRARHASAKSPVSSHHVSHAHPQWVRAWGHQLWLDPSDSAVQDHCLAVILDVVRRYDVDGVHLDDYFYPYPEKDGSGREMDFPDETNWRRYAQSGGKLSKADWRRENVNTFIRRLYQGVKARKPWVKCGVSPFGIWRPGYPASVRGFDAYEKLYADPRRWLGNGWLDYCSPQLYWSIGATNQSYPVLLQWWAEQNVQHRHLWPGNSVYRAALLPGELPSQIRLTRQHGGASGNLLWSMKTLRQNKGGVADELTRLAYNQQASIPASTWLNNQPPTKPALSVSRDRQGWIVSWQARRGEPAWLWVLQRKSGQDWVTEIVPGSTTSQRLSTGRPLPQGVAVRAVDRYGNLSPPAMVVRVEK